MLLNCRSIKHLWKISILFGFWVLIFNEEKNISDFELTIFCYIHVFSRTDQCWISIQGWQVDFFTQNNSIYICFHIEIDRHHFSLIVLRRLAPEIVVMSIIQKHHAYKDGDITWSFILFLPCHSLEIWVPNRNDNFREIIAINVIIQL